MGVVRLYSEALGKEVEVPERPGRIVSLSPALTEILYRIGAWDRVVGVSVFCNKPPEAREKPRVGSYYKVNYRLLDELRPDLVLTTTGAQRGVVEELAEKGYPVYPIPLPTSVYGVLDEIVTVGMVVGELAAARALAGELVGRLAGLRGSLKGVKLYYEINLGGPVSAGAHSYIGDSFAFLGASTPFDGERVPWIINPDPRAVEEFDPDVVIYEFNPVEEASVERAVERLRQRGLGGLRAVREGRVVALPGDSLAHYGPSLVDVLERLAAEVPRLLSRGRPP